MDCGHDKMSIREYNKKINGLKHHMNYFTF